MRECSLLNYSSAYVSAHLGCIRGYISATSRLNTVARLAVWSDDVVVEEADVLAVEAARAARVGENEEVAAWSG